MKKSNGFTLVELLAVIVILAIVSLIAVPNISGLLNKGKNNMFCQKVKSIEAAAKYYAQDYADKLTFNNDISSVKVATLLEYGYIKEDNKNQNDVKDPRTDADLKNVDVTIKIISGRYYGAYPLSDKDKKLCDKTSD